MASSPFVVNKPVMLEESRQIEFKEIKGNHPVDTIKNTADEYVVAFLNSEGGRIYWGIRDSDRTVVGVRLDAKQRDDIRRVVSDKLGQIQPSISPTSYKVLFHEIYDAGRTGDVGHAIDDLFVVEIVVPKAITNQLYFTGSSMAFVKTDAGKKRLSGAELNDEIVRRLRQNQLPETLMKTVGSEPEQRVALLKRYESQLNSKVSYVKIPGGTENYPLDKAFVKLSLSKQFDPRRGDSRHLSFLNSELRRLQTILVLDGENSALEKSLKDVNLLSPDDFLMRPVHALITGAPGCGKTTLLRYWTSKLLRTWDGSRSTSFLESSEPHVIGTLPIFLELKQLTDSNFERIVNLENLLLETCIVPLTKPRDGIERSVLEHRFYSLLERGHISIFLDGLDEISGAKFFTLLQRMISTFLDSPYGKNTVVISSRPFSIRQLGNAQIMEIEPLTEEKMEQFIAHYFGKTIKTIDFLDLLKSRRDLRELARSPALLGFLVMMWRDGHLKNQSKLALYERISQEQSLQLDHEKEGVLPDRKWLVADADGSVKQDFLRFFAFDTLFTGLQEFERTDTVPPSGARLVFSGSRLLAAARRFAKRIGELEGTTINPRELAEDVKVTVLLRQVGMEQYAFSHLTLHEYLAASELAEREDCKRILCRAYFDPMLSAMEVLPMAIGLCSDAEYLLQAVARLPESLSLARMHVLARSLQYRSSISIDSIETVRDELVKFLEDYDLDFDKAEMLESYAWLRKYPLYCRSFSVLLKREDPKCRRRVAMLLGLVGDKEVVPELLEALNDSDSKVRSKVVVALGQIGDIRAAPILSKLIDEDHENFSDYFRALKQLGVLTYLDTSGNDDLQELIVKSSLDWQIKKILSQELRETGLTDELRSTIKAYCLEGLRQIDSQVEAAKKFLLNEPKTIFDIVTEAWEDRDPAVRDNALALLEELGKADELVALMENEIPVEIEARKRAIQSIARVGGVQAVICLLVALRDPSSEVRWVARKGLSQMNTEEIRLGLCKALTNEQAFVRSEAASALPYYVSESGLLAELAATDPVLEVRRVASDSLKRLHQKLQYFTSHDKAN